MMSQQIGELVSKQAVDTLVDELARAISDERCCMSRGRSTGEIMQDILDLPSANPWIPVSERLPEKSGRYLAHIASEYFGTNYIMTCEYFADGPYRWFPDDECASNNVIAWMPLPELCHYKVESEDKE